MTTLDGNPLPLLVKGSGGTILESQAGVQQGCNFGTLLFALGIHPVLGALKDLRVNVWYADDGTIVGPLSAVELAFKALLAEFRKIGLEINGQKCVTWSLV